MYLVSSPLATEMIWRNRASSCSTGTLTSTLPIGLATAETFRPFSSKMALRRSTVSGSSSETLVPHALRTSIWLAPRASRTAAWTTGSGSTSSPKPDRLHTALVSVTEISFGSVRPHGGKWRQIVVHGHAFASSLARLAQLDNRLPNIGNFLARPAN